MSSHEISPHPQEETYHYEVMVPSKRHGTPDNLADMQERYLHKVSMFIGEITRDPENIPDALVFLDKSARPLAWMTKTFWDEFAPQAQDPETGEYKTVPRPEFKFANIDRLKWRKNPQQEFAVGGMKEPSKGDIAGLRAVFDISKEHTLDDKKVLIIDEQSESGDTLTAAKHLFKEAFPTAEVSTTAWINHPSKLDRNGNKVYDIQEIPVWYPLKDSNKLPDEVTGRGVYNPLPFALRSDSFKERHPQSSSQFLSSRPQVERELSPEDKARVEVIAGRIVDSDDPEEIAELLKQREEMVYTSQDERSNKLRRDIGHMLLDFMSGKLTPMLDEDAFDRRETIRGVPVDEYLQQRRQVVSAKQKKR